MTEREALKLALETLLHAYHEDEAHPKTLEAITAIKEALREHAMYEVQRLGQEIQPEPPQRTWVGLTDEDWDEIFGNALTIGEAIKVTEAKLKEKNT